MNRTIHECYEAYTTLRNEMGRWLKQSMLLDPPGPNDGGEDEANYALAWFPHYLITGDTTVLQHFDTLKAALLGWVKRDCVHGYEPKAEATSRTGTVFSFSWAALHRFWGASRIRKRPRS